MLPPSARLRRRADFSEIVRRGRRAGNRALLAYVVVPAVGESEGLARGESAGPARVGFTLSRSVGGAVVRNRLRRRLRSLVRARLSTLPAGATLVLRPTPAAVGLSFEELGRELDSALSRALPARRGHRDRPSSRR